MYSFGNGEHGIGGGLQLAARNIPTTSSGVGP
jgi:hypothetical protein